MPWIRSAGGVLLKTFGPLDLFTGGQGGAWYDPSDLSHMWQDTAGTVPVTTDGQSVLRIDDKSGNGLHLIQAVGALAPLYKTDGTLRWLQFDGLTQYLSRAAVDLTAFFRVSLFFSTRKSVQDAQRILIEHGTNVSSVNGTFGVSMPNSTTFTQIGGRHRGATATIASVRGQSTAPVSDYTSMISDLQAPSLQTRNGGAASAVASGATGGGNFTSQTLYLGARAGLTNFFSGNVYEMMFVMKTATASEITNAENYCRLKAGL